MDRPTITLVDRNEVLHYQDSLGSYTFDVGLQGKRWIVYLLPRKGTMSQQEQARLFPHIKAYLCRRWWFGIWPANYEVTFEVKRGA